MVGETCDKRAAAVKTDDNELSGVDLCRHKLHRYSNLMSPATIVLLDFLALVAEVTGQMTKGDSPLLCAIKVKNSSILPLCSLATLSLGHLETNWEAACTSGKV